MDFARMRAAASPVTLANFAVAVLIAVVAAVGGVVATDVLGEPWAVIVLVIAGLGLLYAIARRNEMRRTTGTIFNVQVLDESSRDLRESSRKAAGINRMAVRSITRWVDFEDRVHDGVIDVVDVCRDVRNALEIQINTDSPETGFTLAPVLPWPMGLALGGESPLPDGLRLVELTTAGLPTMTIDPRSTTDKQIRTEPMLDKGPAGRVGVLLGFTGRAAEYLDQTTGTAATVWRDCGVSQAWQITTLDGKAHDFENSLTDADVDGLGAAVAAELVRVHDQHPDRELVVLGMVTKAMSLAIGWSLARHQCRFFHRTHLMHFDETRYRLVPMRVKQSQPRHAPAPISDDDHA